MSKVIAIANQKGGVAKTTTACSLGVGLSNKDRRVLLIDNDPQASLTEAMGFQNPDELEITLASVMEKVVNEESFDLSEGIIHHKEGVDRRKMNPSLNIEGILMTMVDKRTNYAKDISEVVENIYGEDIYIFKNYIPASVRAAETPAMGVTIFEHDKNGRVAKAYDEMAKEVICHE